MDDAIRKITIDVLLEVAPAVHCDGHSLPLTARLYELGLDSISMLSLLLKLESRLPIDLVQMGDDLRAPDTVEDLFGLVGRLLELSHATNNINDQYDHG